MSNNAEFVKILWHHLEKQDRTQAWLAERLEVNRATVSRWINHETLPNSPDMVIRIADVLGIHNDAERAALMKAAGYVFYVNKEETSGMPQNAPEAEPVSAVGNHQTTKAEIAPNDASRYLLRIIGIGITIVIVGGSAVASCAPDLFTTESPTPIPLAGQIAQATATSAPSIVQITNYNGPVDQSTTNIQQLTIVAGDSPAIQQQKAAQRAALIAGEIGYYLRNVDERLGLVKAALQEDAFGDKVDEVRATVAPVLVDTVKADYDRLITAETISSLRAQLNAYPLTNAPSPVLLQLAADSDVDPTALRLFYDQLGEVQGATDELFDTMAEKVKKEVNEAEWDHWADYYARRIQLAEDALNNRAQLVQAYGIALTEPLREAQPDIIQLPEPFTHLAASNGNQAQPLAEVVAQLATESEVLSEQRAVLVAEGERLLNEELTNAAAAIMDDLTIEPDDTWDLVSAKAISLRQLGHQDKALDAFTQYGEMFADTDPMAKQYASDARQFTIHMERLGIIDGAVYIYAVLDDSPAQRAGLQARDILIALNGQPIRNMIDIETALAQLPKGKSVEFEILRFDELGLFQRQQFTSDEEQPFGMAMMPI